MMRSLLLGETVRELRSAVEVESERVVAMTVVFGRRRRERVRPRPIPIIPR
jgi:hypothetical protein